MYNKGSIYLQRTCTHTCDWEAVCDAPLDWDPCDPNYSTQQSINQSINITKVLMAQCSVVQVSTESSQTKCMQSSHTSWKPVITLLLLPCGRMRSRVMCSVTLYVHTMYMNLIIIFQAKWKKIFFLNHREGDDYNSWCEPLILLQCTNLGFQVYQASLELCNVLWRFDNGKRFKGNLNSVFADSTTIRQHQHKIKRYKCVHWLELPSCFCPTYA